MNIHQITIDITDNGRRYYSVTPSSDILARQYDSMNVELTINKPEIEKDSECHMMILDEREQILGNYVVGDKPLDDIITTWITQHEYVQICFYFEKGDYLKNTDLITMKMLKGVKPRQWTHPTPPPSTSKLTNLYNQSVTQVTINSEDAYNKFYEFRNIEDKVRFTIPIQNSVLYSKQTLTSSDKAQARENIDVVSKADSVVEIEVNNTSGVITLTYGDGHKTEITTNVQKVIKTFEFKDGIFKFTHYDNTVTNIDITPYVEKEIKELSDAVVHLESPSVQEIKSDIRITGNFEVTGDLIQKGSAYETHAEKVYSKNDIIHTREGAISGLSSGEFTGIEAIKYNGKDNGRLVFDNEGTARVGDVGDEQPLTTRDESQSMIDKELTYWDSTTNKLKTTTKGSSGDFLVASSGKPEWKSPTGLLIGEASKVTNKFTFSSGVNKTDTFDGSFAKTIADKYLDLFNVQTIGGVKTFSDKLKTADIILGGALKDSTETTMLEKSGETSIKLGNDTYNLTFSGTTERPTYTNTTTGKTQEILLRDDVPASIIIEDILTSTYRDHALSANMGRVLQESKVNKVDLKTVSIKYGSSGQVTLGDDGKITVGTGTKEVTYNTVADAETDTLAMMSHLNPISEGINKLRDDKVDKVEYSKTQTFADGSDGGVIGRLYMRFRDNTENSIVANCQNVKYTVPVRDSTGNFYVGNPTQLYHTTTKTYVDTADTTLQTNIDTEESERKSADETLQTNINTEASTRETNDNTLQANIDAEETARINAVATEKSERTAADNTLQTNIDNLESYSDGEFLHRSGGEMTGNIVLNNTIKLSAKSSTGVENNVLNVTSSNNISLGSSGLSNIDVNNTIRPVSTSINLGTSSNKFGSIFISDEVNSNKGTFSGDVNVNGVSYLNKGAIVTGDLTIKGNLTQEGTTYNTHAEEVFSKSDYIYLREGNTGGLADGSYSGFQFVKYDGTTDGHLVVDNKGIARVGDVGDEQPLATREETPNNFGIAYWDNTNTRLSTIGAGTSGYILKSNGTAAPSWINPTTSLTAYKTSKALTLQSSATTTTTFDGSTARTLSTYYVDRFTTQDIYGDKKFRNEAKHFDNIELYNSSNIEGEAGNNIVEFYNENVGLADTNTSGSDQIIGVLTSRSKESAFMTKLLSYKTVDGTIGLSILLRNNSATDGVYASSNDIYKTVLSTTLGKDGVATISTLTPELSSNSGRISTTAWVRNFLTDRTINYTAVDSLAGITSWVGNTKLPTLNTIAYWNGSYASTSNSSNLRYCKYGEIVGTTGTQTISGSKTFTTQVRFAVDTDESTGTHAIVVGSTNATNMRIDNNEIDVLTTDGSRAWLGLNSTTGGDITIGNASSGGLECSSYNNYFRPITSNVTSIGQSGRKFKDAYFNTSVNIGSCTMTYNTSTASIDFVF